MADVASESESSERWNTVDSTADAPLIGVKKEPEVYLGTDRMVDMPEARKAISLNGEAVTLNFQAAPLVDVVNGVLGDILSLDYVVEGEIKGVVSLRTHSAIPRSELLIILESMLQANGYRLIRTNDDRYLVTGDKTVSSRWPRYDSPNSAGAGYTNVIVPLDYISAAQMVEILKPVASDAAFLRVDTLRNLIIIAGTRTQLTGWLEIIDTFDVDVLQGMSVAIMPIEHTTVEEVDAALGTLLASAPNGDGDVLKGLVRVVPLESLGSILIVTSKASYLERVKHWIQRLDRTPEAGAEPQLFVYPVQNGTAEHLADLLGNIFGSSGGSSSDRKGNNVAPGLTPTSFGSGSGGASTGSGMSRAGGNSTRSAANGSSSFAIGDSIRIVSDDVNNALLVYATSADYKKIRLALDQLDVVPSQVLIEASILEVTLNDDLRYGLEWYLDNSLGGGWNGSGQLDVGDAGIELTAPGFGYAFSNPLGDLRVVLNTLASKELVKVISTPSIMVLDNHSAAIHVGDQTPIQSSTTVSDGGNITSSITYRDTGVKLDVTPSVNAGGLVTMDLLQSVTDVGSDTNATGQVAFFERNINSRVAVRSGESVVLGGLIRDNKTKGESGLPFFKDLPVIGHLFGSTTVSDRRTELLVIITPHVITSDQDLRDVTLEMRKRMSGLKMLSAEDVAGSEAKN
ncbi:type II secretion system secretin GspD [Gilvimarinus japonicus]